MHASVELPNSDGESQQDRYIKQAKVVLEKLLEKDIEAKPGKDGRCECIWCNGRKKRKCSWCNGKGVRYELAQKSWEDIAMEIEKMRENKDLEPQKELEKVPVQCSACSGTKELRCAYCRGSGIGSYGHAY